MHKQRVAARFVNLMDRVTPAPYVPVPGFVSIKRVDLAGKPEVNFTRDQRAPGEFWSEFNDLTLANLVGRGLQGE